MMEEELEVYMEGMEEEEPDETNERKFKFERYIFYSCSVLLALSIGLLTLSYYFPDTVPEKYGLGGCIGSLVLFALGYFCLMFRGNFGQRRASIWPFGFNRRAAQGGQHIRLRTRRPRTGRRRNISVERASASRVPRINPSPAPSSSQPPGIHFSSGHSSQNLPGQERASSESPLSEERSRLLAPVSVESSATPTISAVASSVSTIASKSVPRREGMLTRSLSRQGPDTGVENSPSSSGARNINPATQGPSGLQSPELHESSEPSVRHLRSGVKKTGSETQRSKRQSVLKSPVSGRSTASRRMSEEATTPVSDAASGGVRRRREKFASRKASTEEQTVSDRSDPADYERRCRSSLM